MYSKVYDRLKPVGAAVLAYHAEHHRLPPMAIRSADGAPLLSWRVAILPCLGADAAALYQEFKLDEPWDSPHNRGLLQQMPAVYRLPFDRWTPSDMTFLQVLVGPGTAFERDGLRLDVDFPDGADKTILIAEAANAVPWTRPVDLVYDPGRSDSEFGAGLPKSSYRRRNRGMFFIILADGRPDKVYPQVPPFPIRAIITRNGGENVPMW
jgi:hypothetical protein